MTFLPVILLLAITFVLGLISIIGSNISGNHIRHTQTDGLSKFQDSEIYYSIVVNSHITDARIIYCVITDIHLSKVNIQELFLWEDIP